jgi:hypothetical protein
MQDDAMPHAMNIIMDFLHDTIAPSVNYDECPDCQPPLWSSGRSSWLQIQRSWIRFLALPDFLRSNGSGTGSTQPREDN